MGTNGNIPNSSCEPPDHINPTNNNTQASIPSKLETRWDHMVKFVELVAANNSDQKEDEMSPGNHNEGQNTPHHYGFKRIPKPNAKLWFPLVC